jgi:transposase InsO family protein
LSPIRRREVFESVRKLHPQVSTRRICELVGLSRNAIKAPTGRIDKDKPLVAALTKLATERPRSGYRMLYGMLMRDGFDVGRDQVYRLCRKHGFRVPRKVRIRRAIGQAANAVHVLRATAPNDVWTWDFVSDQTFNDGRSFRILTVVDEYTRRPLLTYVDRQINSCEVIRQLELLFKQHGVPRHIRSDNGPEFIAKALQAYLAENKVKTLYVEPGSPWQNGMIESFNGRLRDECLNIEMFSSVLEARVIIGDYRTFYEERRPHSALGYRTPKQFAETLERSHAAAPVQQCMATLDQQCPMAHAVGAASNAGNQVDGAGDEAPLPLQTSPSTPLPCDQSAAASREIPMSV